MESASVHKKFHPPRSFKRTIGLRSRYCQRSSFDKYKFLHYDVEKDTPVLSHMYAGCGTEEDT